MVYDDDDGSSGGGVLVFRQAQKKISIFSILSSFSRKAIFFRNFVLDFYIYSRKRESVNLFRFKKKKQNQKTTK